MMKPLPGPSSFGLSCCCAVVVLGSSSHINAIPCELVDGSLPANSYACSLMASVEMCSLNFGTYPVGKTQELKLLTERGVSGFLTGALARKIGGLRMAAERGRGLETNGHFDCLRVLYTVISMHAHSEHFESAINVQTQ